MFADIKQKKYVRRSGPAPLLEGEWAAMSSLDFSSELFRSKEEEKNNVCFGSHHDTTTNNKGKEVEEEEEEDEDNLGMQEGDILAAMITESNRILPGGVLLNHVDMEQQR